LLAKGFPPPPPLRPYSNGIGLRVNPSLGLRVNARGEPAPRVRVMATAHCTHEQESYSVATSPHSGLPVAG